MPFWMQVPTPSDAPRVDLYGSRAVGLRRRAPVVAKTANYTCTAEESGTIFTTRGATAAVNFTTPAPADAIKGVWYRFIDLVDQNMGVLAGTINTVIVFNNNATADGVIFNTAGHKFGAVVDFHCDGTSWLAVPGCKNTLTIVTG